MSEVYDLEKQREDAQERINLRATALKLYKNSDFKKLILQEFCVNECARYAQLSSDPALTPAVQADCLGLAQAAGHLRRYLSVVVTMGNNAEANMERLDQSIVEARQAEIEGED